MLDGAASELGDTATVDVLIAEWLIRITAKLVRNRTLWLTTNRAGLTIAGPSSTADQSHSSSDLWYSLCM